MKKTMKKRAFISAIAMLIVSAIVLTSSTFAWFSMSKEAQVSSMNLNITTADGISISANTKKFGTTVTVDDIIPTADNAGKGLAADADHTNNIPELLAPASSRLTLSASDGYLPAFFTGSISENGYYVNTTKVASDKDGKYVVFDLFVQVSENNKVVSFKGSSIENTEESVLKVMRMGIINCGYEEYQNRANVKTKTTSNRSNISLWVVDGNASDNTLYIDHAGDFVKESGGVYTQYGVDPTYAANVCKSADADGLTFTAMKGVNRIRIYLWVEGNDPDCTNDVAGNNFDFNLKLSID
ncbi:MAG: hypothetical protein MJ168_01405 [Clostridia bacterium]|nr:hypothetical protein [Clostridia bacterium]